MGVLELVVAVIYASWSCFISLFGMLLDHSVDILVTVVYCWNDGAQNKFGGIKQEIQEFKAEFNSLLVDLKNEIQTKFGNINNKLSEIENSIKSNITEQVGESIISIKESIIDALKEENKLLKSKVLNLEHKLSQSEAGINNLDQYNWRNNLEIQGIPLISLMMHWKIK